MTALEQQHLVQVRQFALQQEMQLYRDASSPGRAWIPEPDQIGKYAAKFEEFILRDKA